MSTTEATTTEATTIASELDRAGAWDWTDGSEHDPSDRYAVVERGDVWLLVYAGTEGAEVWEHNSKTSAAAHLQEEIGEY